MLRMYNEQPGEPQFEDIACQWMNENEAVWSQWKPVDLATKTELYIGGIFPITGPFYSAPGMVPGKQLLMIAMTN